MDLIIYIIMFIIYLLLYGHYYMVLIYVLPFNYSISWHNLILVILVSQYNRVLQAGTELSGAERLSPPDEVKATALLETVEHLFRQLWPPDRPGGRLPRPGLSGTFFLVFCDSRHLPPSFQLFLSFFFSSNFHRFVCLMIFLSRFRSVSGRICVPNQSLEQPFTVCLL